MENNALHIWSDNVNINQADDIIESSDSKDSNIFYQEIMSALEQKDFQRIVTLALSQSKDGKKLGMLLNDTMLAIGKSPNKSIDINIIEKISSIIRSQPKSNTSVLRATVAPIRNESVVTISSVNATNCTVVSNTLGARNTSRVTRCSDSTDISEHNMNNLFTSEIKIETSKSHQNVYCLADTLPMVQTPSKLLKVSSASSNDNYEIMKTSDDVDQCGAFETQHGNGAMSYVQFSNQSGSMVLHGGVNAHSMQYQSNFMGNNGIVCIVTPSMTGEHSKQAQSKNYPFVVPQNILVTVPGSTGLNPTCQSVMTTSTITPGITDTSTKISTNVTTAIASNSLCSNLQRILPKPGNIIIAPKSQYSQQYATQTSNQLPLISRQLKRPSSSRRVSVRAKKPNNMCAGKDNIMMAWEIADKFLPSTHNSSVVSDSFLNHLEADSHDLRESVCDKEMYNQCNEYEHSDSTGNMGGLDDLFESINDDKHYVSVTITVGYLENLCQKNIVQLKTLHVITVAPLARATISGPSVMSGSVNVVVSKLCNSKEWLVGHGSIRMDQLLHTHFGQCSEFMSSLLRCLLPSESRDNLLHISRRSGEPDGVLNLSEKNIVVAATNTGLESSICDSSYNVVGIVNTRLSSELMLNNKTINLQKSMCRGSAHAFNKDNELSPTLHSLCNDGWLKRRSHSLSNWTVNGSKVSWSKSLEIPAMADHQSRVLILRKKSNYLGRLLPQTKLMVHSRISKPQKYRERLSHIRWDNETRQQNTKRSANICYQDNSSGRLKIRIHLARPLDTLESLLEANTETKVNIPKQRDTIVEHASNEPTTLYNNTILNINNIKIERLYDTISTNIKNHNSIRLTKMLDPLKQDDIKTEPVTEDTTTTKTECYIDKNSKVVVVELDDIGALIESLSGHCNNLPKLRSKDSNKIEITKNSIAKKKTSSRTKKSLNISRQVINTSKQSKKGEPNTRRIFCTRKEDRRSSVLYGLTGSNSSVKKPRPSQTKRKRRTKRKARTDHPPLIVKLCAKKIDLPVVAVAPSPILTIEEEIQDQVTVTSDSIKLFIKRSGLRTYMSQLSNTQKPDTEVDEVDTYQYSPSVNLAPPTQYRSRQVQPELLEFSPAHSASDTEVVVAHNEISSLLQRHEQREPLSGEDIPTFPSLPVPYMVSTEPSVYMDPHEIDIVVVKNSRYKKVSSSDFHPQTSSVNMFPEANNSDDLFVPGCFIDQDKTNIDWNKSSPSMPVLAPQEPCASSRDTCKSTRSSHSKTHSIQSNKGLRPQKFPDHSNHSQQSPLCMTTNTQYSSSSNHTEVIAPDPTKSPPYYHHGSYIYQPTYNSSCYLGDTSAQTTLQPSSSESKTQIKSQTGVANQVSVSSACSSQLPDYSFFHNSNQQTFQGMAEASLFPIPTTTYQPILSGLPNHHSANKSSSKRSSSRSQAHDQSQSSSSSSCKKRKEAIPESNSLAQMYPNNSDLYNVAAQYSGLDYYGAGFSNILGNMDQMKLYEQCAREYSLQLGSNMSGIYPNFQWSDAMTEYCKQAAALNPPVAAASSPGPSNPLSLSTSLQSSDYSNSYAAYAMSHPYSMYSSFGMPK